MKKENLFDTLGDINNQYIKEAHMNNKRKNNFVWAKWGTIAACFLVMVAICTILNPFGNNMTIAAYAHGSNEAITSAGVIVNTGTIDDNGVMTGHPLMFYISGEDIESIRFSCKNQLINFMDWTEQREEYGNAQNFTVKYGEDESEYYYLTIEWIPNMTIRELTDNAETTIATLPAELREDIIVMEITFSNGKTATKAITVSLLDDGRFFASFDDHEITTEDSFIERSDSESIPREILYEQGANAMDDVNTSSNVSCDDMSETVAELNELETALGNNSIETAKEIACNYYKNTVFEVVSMELKKQTTKEISFYVCVSKGGVVQEPNRTIFLQLVNGNWQVVNEGY